MPGYTSEKGNARDMKDVEREAELEIGDGRTYGWASRESEFIPVASEVSFKKAIPAMPKSLAFFCSLCNCIVPGLGTFLSGVSIGCHLSISRNGPEVPQTHVICVNVRAAFLQLITTPLLFIGWFWSVLWAAAFLIISEEYDVLRSSATSPRRLTTTRTTATTISTISTTTTMNSDPQDGFTSLLEASIIVLQQPPIIIHPPPTPRVVPHSAVDTTVLGSQLNLSVGGRGSYRSRRRARIRRDNRALNPILMDPATLEHIVHHSSIVPQPDRNFVEVTGGK